VEMVCPACNKANDEETRCSRCGADLSALVQIRRSADQALKIGTRSLKQNDGRNALHQAEIAWHLKNSAEAARLCPRKATSRRQIFGSSPKKVV
jgi:hypothetical protein